MNPYRKAALLLIRMVAFAFILVGLLLLSSYVFYAVGQKKPEGGIIWILLKAIPVLIGLVLLLKSGAIARKLTEDFDE
jgi:hypothetical protein